MQEYVVPWVLETQAAPKGSLNYAKPLWVYWEFMKFTSV